MKIVISVDHANFSAVETDKVFYHNAIENQVEPVTVPAALTTRAVVLATFKVPDNTGGRNAVPVTLALNEKVTIGGKTKDRLLALTDALIAWDDAHTKIKVVKGDLGLGQVTLKVTPLAESQNKTPVALDGGDLPVKIQMANPSPTAVTGTLRFDASRPADTALTTAGTALANPVKRLAKSTMGDVEAENGLAGPVVSLSSGAPGVLAPFFWLVAGKDEFQREFKVGPGRPPSSRSKSNVCWWRSRTSARRQRPGRFSR